jgi:hypothetical protein
MHPDRRPLRLPKPKKILPFWFEVVLAASGASDPDVPMDATFHGSSIGRTIGGRVRLRRQEISPIFPDLQKEQTSVVNTVYRLGKIYRRCR